MNMLNASIPTNIWQNNWISPEETTHHGVTQGSNKSEAPFIASNDPTASRFKAAGQVQMPQGGIGSATLIANSASPDPNSPALILTAGHVVLGANQHGAVLNMPEEGHFVPSNFKDTAASHQPFEFDKVLYASTANGDMAVVQLKATYGDLAKLGIKPMQLDSVQNHPGMNVETAHTPVDGIPSNEQFMRYSKGKTYESKTVQEGRWRWPNMVLTNLQGIHGGSSGASVFPVGSNKVIGILTTGNNNNSDNGILTTQADSDGKGCGLNQPCEIDHNGHQYVRWNSVYYTPVSPALVKSIKDNDFNGLIPRNSERATIFDDNKTYTKGNTVFVPGEGVYTLAANSSTGEDPVSNPGWWYSGKIPNFPGAMTF